MKNRLTKYYSVINYRTLISISISIIATWLACRYKLIFNLDLTLISVAVVFPLVFTLGSAFQRRERALEHLGRAKGALAAIKYCFSFSRKIEQSEKQEIYKYINNVKSELIKFLYAKDNDKTALNKAIGQIQDFISSSKSRMEGGLSLKVYKLMRDVIMGIENSISIKLHGTPESIRAYCEVFIYVFPFFYAPTLIKNIVYQDIHIDDIINGPSVSILDNHFVLIVYGLNIILSFLLITLFNVQEQIENPFDQDGIDDIKLENYELDYML